MEGTDINWLAVGVGTVAAFLLGWLVYSPILFLKGWAEGSGMDAEGDGPGGLPIVLQIIALLALSTVVGITATTDALFTAILAILACAVFVVSTGAFVRKSRFALMVDGGYILAAGVVMIAAQGIL